MRCTNAGNLQNKVHSTRMEDANPLISFELLQRQQELLNKQLQKETILRKQLADLQRKQSRVEKEQKQLQDHPNTQSIEYPSLYTTSNKTKRGTINNI